MMHLPIAGVVSGGAGAGAPSTLLNGLTSWWTLDEASGTRFDAHGVNDLTDTNTVTQAVGQVNNAAEFLSLNAEYLVKTNPTGLNGGDRDFTFALWVRKTDSNTTALLKLGALNSTVAANMDYMVYSVTGDTVFYGVYNGSSLFGRGAGSGLPVNTWTLVMGWWDSTAGSINFQQNNGSISSGTPSTPLTHQTNAISFQVAAGYGLTELNGRMDEIAFWDRLLTTDEKSEIWNSGNGIGYPGTQTPTFLSSTGASGSNTGSFTQTVNKPPGVAEGDLLVMIATTRNCYAALPTGGAIWAEKFTYALALSAIATPRNTDDSMYCWWKIAGASEPASYDIAMTDVSTDGHVIQCLAFRNATELADWAASAGKIAPTIIALEGDCLASFHATAFDTDATWAYPTDMVAIRKDYETVSDTGAAIAFERGHAAGATGTRTWTSDWANYSIAMNLLIR